MLLCAALRKETRPRHTETTFSRLQRAWQSDTFLHLAVRGVNRGVSWIDWDESQYAAAQHWAKQPKDLGIGRATVGFAKEAA